VMSLLVVPLELNKSSEVIIEGEGACIIIIQISKCSL
jgi:hypothetical protein